jgi:hypothetical protein
MTFGFGGVVNLVDRRLKSASSSAAAAADAALTPANELADLEAF